MSSPHAAALERLKRDHAGQRVLLAEDNPINCAIAAELLRHPGLVVQTVGDGRGAVEVASSAPFDLVLMDVQMPGMDGLEAARALRAAGISTPIVAMTGNAGAQDRAACLEAGMDDLVAKPVAPKALYEALLAWLPASTGGDDPGPLAERLAAVDGFDPAVGLASVGGAPSALARVLGRFADTYRAGVPELIGGATPEQRGARRRAVHALRGAATTLGAVTLQGTLEAFERAENAGLGEAELDALARQAQEELRTLADALGAALSA